MAERTQKDFRWISYPRAKRVEQVDLYHGVEVADPYRWLEEESSDETQAWLDAQGEIAERFFAELPERERAVAHLREQWVDGVGSVPTRRGENAFSLNPEKGKPHAVVHVQRGRDAKPEVVFDLNENDPDGLRTIAPSLSVSPKGRFVAYFIQHRGADDAEVHVHDVEAGRTLEEVLPPAYFTRLAWLRDESSFYYSYVDHQTLIGRESEKPPGIYFHQIGTPFDEDPLVYAQTWEGQRVALPYVTDDGAHLLVQHLHVMGARGGWGFRTLVGDGELTWLMDPNVEHRFAYVGTAGSEVFFVTDYEAPNWRLVALDLKRPGLEHLREVIPEQEQPISLFAGGNPGSVALEDELLFVTYIDHNAHVIRIFDLEGKAQGEIPLPFLSNVTRIATKEGDPEVLVGLQSFVLPHEIHVYDRESKTLAIADQVEVPAAFADYEVKRVFYPSKDGTEIPLTLIHRRGLERDGSAKLLLYGYGGWGIPLLPTFSNTIALWVEMGGVYAVANLRGGNEYGEAWHQAGQFFNKQNVFDDFCAAAEYVVRKGYTSHRRITMVGASNGGLLTAACYNQRPELFGAVLSLVAAVDLLRLPYTPIGATQSMELGDPGISRQMFEYLVGYSPLHNVRHKGFFPPILHIVGERDPRCKPGHIYKLVAEMQRMGDPERLVVLRLLHGVGHGTSNKDALIDLAADEFAFAWQMTE